MEITDSKEKNLHANHRSRVKQKFIKYGLAPFEEHEILELLLFFSIPQIDTNPLAHNLIREFGSLKEVLDAPLDRLKSVNGIGENSAILIRLLSSMLSKYGQLKTKQKTVLNNQNLAKSYVASLFNGVTNEQFYVICVNAKSEVVGVKELNNGSETKVDVDIRQLTNFVLQKKCDRILIAHNHPNGNPFPSDSDIGMTRKICNSCILNDIELLDHIIYSPYGVISFAEEGFIDAINQNLVSVLKFSTSRTELKSMKNNVTPYEIVRTNKNS